MSAVSLKRSGLLLVLFAALLLTACNSLPSLSATPTPTVSFTPTATAVPMAAIVNGEGITLAEFEAELARYQAAQTALGVVVAPETARQIVLDDLIDQVLLAQGAQANGFVVDEAMLQVRIDALAVQIGGAQALATWQAEHGYTDETFRQALRRQIAAAWMCDRIAAGIPPSAEQVHVKQILLYNAAAAQQVLAQLQSGADFSGLAAYYDPVTQGELGWFPRGYLPEAAIEEAAFSLQPGQYSDVIQTQAGFHIILVIERDPDHPLSPDALLTLQYLALEDWLRQQRAASTIVTLP